MSNITSRLILPVLALLLVMPLFGQAKVPSKALPPIEQAFQEIRYTYDRQTVLAQSGESGFDDLGAGSTVKESSELKRKSPMKAFLLSMVVPGLGQYYNGSRIKPLAFAGVEVATLYMHFKWESDGDKLTDEFEAFNRAHWSQDDYEQRYLNWVYGVTDDEDVVDAREISHHLPDTRIQQYYEMTGKYRQFSWGWDDAELNGSTLDDFDAGNPPPAIQNAATTPYSQNKMDYEDMRHAANQKHANASDILFLSMANRLAAGFEAFFAARKINRRIDGGSAFSKVRVRPTVLSEYALMDTPYLRVAYQF